MKFITRYTALAVLLCLSVHSLAADTPKPRRTTISLLANGKEVAGLVLLPGQGQRQISVEAINQTWTAEGFHASGHVQLTMIMENTTPITLYGDELTLRSEELDADQAQALADLKAMGASDQSIRANPAHLNKDDWARQEAIDKTNMTHLASIIKRYGWPGMRFAGAAYAKNAFMVLQHADSASQRTYLPLLREAVSRGEVPASDLAMLEDRVLKSDGKAQLYGTQYESFAPLKLYLVADPARLDERRRTMGLPPMEVQLQQMQQMYQSN
ncbi:DUF6624 domain-containing protein [Massilia aurea]|uniref:DUF6624 domain-containing protein n=1 Tax=Massilia aurea TaxID=373040 RepID=UPI000F2DE236|nr:DUF6624 domain-containing protein [Massilia aurea]